MAAPDRRPRFRAAVFAPREGMKNSCRVVLLLLAETMTYDGKVSVPRNRLAEQLGVHPSRITEAITLAKKLGFLDTVERGKPGTTAVYQGQIPDRMVRPSAPPSMVRKPGGDMVRPDAPQTGATWCARAVSQVVTASRETNGAPVAGVADDKRSNEKPVSRQAGGDVTACDYHPWQTCPDDCRNADRRAS